MKVKKEDVLKSTLLCRQCKAVIDVDPNPYRPFCSDRCRKVDLGKWFEGSYHIAGAPADVVKKDNSESED